jgi:hypothetical protein
MGHLISAEKLWEPLLIAWLSAKLSILNWLAKNCAYSVLMSWLMAEVFYTQLAGQELCLLQVNRPAEGYGSSHLTDWPSTVLSPIHIDKLN